MISLDTHKLHRFSFLFFFFLTFLWAFCTTPLSVCWFLASFRRVCPNKYKLIKNEECIETSWVIELFRYWRQAGHGNVFVNCAHFQVFAVVFTTTACILTLLVGLKSLLLGTAQQFPLTNCCYVCFVCLVWLVGLVWFFIHLVEVKLKKKK